MGHNHRLYRHLMSRDNNQASTFPRRVIGGLVSQAWHNFNRGDMGNNIYSKRQNHSGRDYGNVQIELTKYYSLPEHDKIADAALCVCFLTIMSGPRYYRQSFLMDSVRSEDPTMTFILFLICLSSRNELHSSARITDISAGLVSPSPSHDADHC